jgi:tetrahydromethanopterin S-methyltransferase subunit G
MKMETLEKLFDAKLEAVHTKLDSIDEQAKKTNGRVSKHDSKLNKHDIAIATGMGIFIAVEFITNLIF